MDVTDLSWNEIVRKRFNNQLLPKSIRGVIIGKSGCGKTTLLLNLLLRPGWLDYNKLAVFGKSLFQPEYRILKKAFEEKLPKELIMRLFEMRDEVIKLDISPSALVEEWAKEVKDKSDIECSFYESAEDVPDPRDLSAENKNLMIFDDLLHENQNKCESFISEEGIATLIVFTFLKIILSSQGRPSEKTQTLFAYFPKTLKTSTTSTMIM